MKYYYAVYDEPYETFSQRGYSYTLNGARMNLMRALMRYNYLVGIVVSDPRVFDDGARFKRDLIGEIWEVADPHIPYNYYWREKGKKRMVPLNKDGSLKNVKR